MTPLPFDRERALALLRRMVRIRLFEERCAELYTQEKIRGFLHLYIGEEAVATGVIDHLGPDDALFATYREHGHALARGVDLNACMAEMFGKQEGCSKGRGGSMHLFDAATRFYGGSAIVAGHLPMAVGHAWADRLQGHPDRVTACFFGEGAAAEGAFHESLNLAALWRAPVLFCLENNGYAMGTALGRSEAQPSFTFKAASYDVPAKAVDGMDVVAVWSAARDAIAAIRAGTGPYLLELQTYRFRAHSMFDAQLYRDKAEVAWWRERDPIPAFEARLRALDWLTDADAAALREEESALVEAAIAFAEAGTWEPVESLLTHMLAEGGAA